MKTSGSQLIVLSVIAALAAACGPAIQPTKSVDQIAKGEGCMPLNEGRAWIYTGKSFFWPMVMAMKITGRIKGPGGTDVAVAAVRVKIPAGMTDSTVYLVDDGTSVRVMRTDTVLDLAKGFGVEGGEVGILYAPPKTEVRKQLAVGDGWSDSFTQYSKVDMETKTGFDFQALVGGAGLQDVHAKEEKQLTDSKKVLAKETVTVPMGTFEAYKVESHPNEAQTFYTWYAEGFGMVKQSAVQDGKEVMVLELADMDSPQVDAYFAVGAVFDIVKKLKWVTSIVGKIL